MNKSSASLRIVIVLAAFAAIEPSYAAPAAQIQFSIPGGAITPAGSVPFDQWISATSSAGITLAEGETVNKTAALEFCEGSQDECPLTTMPYPLCQGQDLPVVRSCTLAVETSPTADGKATAIRVEIPPLRYNSVYRLKLSLAGKKQTPLTGESLKRIDAIFYAEVVNIATSRKSPTARNICESIVNAVKTEFVGRDIRIDAPLKSCAEEGAPIAQVAEVESKIEKAVTAQRGLLRAEKNVAEANLRVKAQAAEAESDLEFAQKEEAEKTDEVEATRQTLKGSVDEVVTRNTWLPIALGTQPVASTARASYVSAETGLLYGVDLKDAIVYVGANIYSRPINTNVSLASLHAQQMLTWRHRLSLTLGTTVGSVESNGKRKGLIGSSAIVIGLGARVTDIVRVSGGVLLFRKENPNPLVTNDQSLTVSPYVALSFDVDIAKGFGKIFPTN